MAKKRDLYAVNGQPVPGVTSITGCLDKPALVPWAAKETMLHIQRYWEAGKTYDIEYINATLYDAKNAHRRRKDTAADIGSEIHALVEAYCGGQLKPSQVEDEYKRRALENFVMATEGWEWVAAEIVVLHDGKRAEKASPSALPYGGTADGLAYLPSGQLVITDTKTSSGVWPEHGLQISMYSYARPMDGSSKAAKLWPEIEEGRILHFDKELCTWEILERDVKQHYPYIIGVRLAYEWKKKFAPPNWSDREEDSQKKAAPAPVADSISPAVAQAAARFNSRK
jgi:hypothetical protein